MTPSNSWTPSRSIEQSAADYAAMVKSDPKASDLYEVLSSAPDPYTYPEGEPSRDEGCERMNNQIRTFETGATRGADDGKLDYEGYLSPIVLRRYAQYMQAHQKQADGKLRPSDNWQKGIPRDEYIKSKIRHDIDLWIAHDSGLTDEDAACAIMFNTMGYLFEILKPRQDNTVGVVNGT